MNLTLRFLAIVTAATLLAGLAPAAVVGASPIATSEPMSLSINEDDDPVTVTMTATDPDGGLITDFSISTPPSMGGLGTMGVVRCGDPGDPCTATVAYTPDPNANGDDSFEFTATDGDAEAATATVAITITAVNDAPSFIKGADQGVPEDAGVQSVAGWATAISPGPADESGQTLAFDVHAANGALFSVQPAISPTGTLTYIPAANAVGSTAVEVFLFDSGGTSNGGDDTSPTETFTITIATDNDPPTAGDDTRTVSEDSGPNAIDALANDLTTPDTGETLTITGVTEAAKGSVAIVGGTSVSYTPDQDANGADSFTYTISDGNGGTDTGTVSVSITAVNDEPVLAIDGSQSVAEDAGAQTVPDWATGTPGPANESGQALAYVIDSITNTSLFSVAPAVSSTGTLTYTPAANANGPSTVTLHLTDNGGGTSASPTQQFTLTILPVNDAPTFVKGADVASAEDAGPQVVASWATAIAAGPADEGSQALTFVVTGNTAPTLFATQPAVDAAGSLTFRPAFNQSGTATISIVLRDNGGVAGGGADTSATQIFDITVSGANDTPNAGNDVVSVRLGPPVTLDVLANDDAGAGEPGDQPRIVSVSEGSGSRGFVSVGPDARSLVYDPIGCATGQHVFQYTIADGGGLMATATVVVTLLAPSSYPAADGPRPSFVTGTTIGSTVPVRLSWCGVTSGTNIDAYRLYQSINDGSYTTRIDKTTAMSSTRSVSVSPTRHQFRIRVKDRKSRDAYGTGPDFQVGRYQDTSSSIVYSTGWSTSRNSAHSGDSVKGTSTSGGSATFTYTGRGFAIVGPRSSTRGKFKVYVDGAYRATVSERSSSAQYRRVLYTASLAHGRHTIRIVAAGGGRIDLDAILTLTGY